MIGSNKGEEERDNQGNGWGKEGTRVKKREITKAMVGEKKEQG